MASFRLFTFTIDQTLVGGLLREVSLDAKEVRKSQIEIWGNGQGWGKKDFISLLTKNIIKQE